MLKTQKHNLVNLWLYSSCVLILIMIGVGGITRLTESGLSMVDWKPIAGSIPPLTEQQWEQEFEKYKEYPEFKMVNSTFSLSDFKTIYFWEYVHRMIARLLGLYFIFPFLYFLYTKQLHKNDIVNLIGIFCLGLIQALAGWYMVKSGLVNVPDVSHYRLAIHLVLAFFLLGLVYWTALGLQASKISSNNFSHLNKKCNFLLLLLLIQITFGAFVSGLNAGNAWNTFPLMNGKIVPDGLFINTPLLLNFFENQLTIQFTHRVLAIFILLYCMHLYNHCIKENINILQARLLMKAVFFQFVLGVLTLIYKVPIILGVAHQVLAAILVLSVVNLKFHCLYKNKTKLIEQA